MEVDVERHRHVIQVWVPAAQHERVHAEAGIRLRGLGVAQREQLQQAHAAGERFVDAVEQQEVLRTGQHVLAHLAALVARRLDLGEDVRRVLRFVDEQMRRARVNESHRIGLGAGAQIAGFEVEIRVIGEYGFE